MSTLFMRTPARRHGAARHDRAASSAAAARCVINRKYLQRIIDVTANVAPGKDLGGASAAVQQRARRAAAARRLHGAARRPDRGAAEGVRRSDRSRRCWRSLLVYMVLASQFKSLIDPLVIMFSVPLGVTGVFLALWLTGTTLSA